MQEEDRKANKTVDPPKVEGGCSGNEGGGLPGDAQQEPPDCSLQHGLEDLLGKVPLPSQGTKVLYTALGDVWGHCLSHHQVASSLACIWLLLFVLRRAPIPDQRCHLNPDQWEICCMPTQPCVAACCLAVATAAHQTLQIKHQPGHGGSPAGTRPWAAFCDALWSTTALIAE